MTSAEPIIVVLGPRCGGTSAVAGVLHHLGVFMGAEFSFAYRELNQSWEESALHQLCVRAFSEPGDQLQMEPSLLRLKLSSWAEDHRRAARVAGRRSGAKDPCLCLAVEFIREAWGPIVPVVVDRPVEKVVASLNRLGWLPNEHERAASTARLIAARDQALAGAATVRVDFEELRASPAAVIRRLADELRLEVTQAQIQAAVDSVVNTAEMPRDVNPYQRFIDRLLPAVQRNPEDARSVSVLAQVYFDAGDFANARGWFARRIELGGSDEEIFVALFRVAQSVEQLGTPWQGVQDAYLLAWEFRPTRAEPFYCIASHYFNEKRYRLGYLFAERAARIPLPADDMIVPYPDVYTWRAADAQARCGFCIGEHHEAFTLWRRLLARPDIPDGDRQRMSESRDLAVPAMLEAASPYSDVLARNLIAGPRDAEVTVSLVAGPDLFATEQTLNSFLQCCTDVSRVGRFLIIDAGLSTDDRAMLQKRYGFIEFTDCSAELGQIRDHIYGRYWLHLGQGWRFFAPEKLITRLVAVLDAETQVFQVGINLADAARLTGTSALELAVRRAPDAGRYVLADVVASGPAMFDTTRLDEAGGVGGTDPNPIAELAGRAAVAGLQTASLDEVLCITAV